MSHIAEVYAKDLGAKIGKPHIIDHFYPNVEDCYVTFQTSNKIEAKNYDYWDVVISLLRPHLHSKGIKMVQVGGPDDPPIASADQVLLGATFRQMNYLIKKAEAHFGVDSLPTHIASSYDIPVVSVFANLYKENAAPLWNKDSKLICLEPDFSEKKPSFSSKETPKRINEIMPEKIAQSVLDVMGIQETVNFTTIHIGKNFHNRIVEIVPNFFGISESLRDKMINLRGDLHFDQNNIFKWSKFCKTNLFLNDEISDGLLEAIKENTKQIIFQVENLDKDFSDFFKKIKRSNINLKICTDNTEIISDLRFMYLDYDVFDTNPEESIKDKITEKTKFFSKKIFLTEGKQFSSEFASKVLDTGNKFVYSEDKLKEIKYLYLYE